MDEKYLAGIFDGEGCIRLSKRKSKQYIRIQISLVIGNTNKILIETLQQDLGGFIITKQTKTGKPFYQWEMTGLKRVKSILERILPYSIVKKETIILTLQLIDKRVLAINKKIPLRHFSEEEISLVNNIRSRNKNVVAIEFNTEI